MYLINGNFLLQYTIYIIYRFLFLYYILYWQSFKDHLPRFLRKRVQNYCFSATWPNFLEDFLNYLRNSLILSTHLLSSQPHLFQHLTEHTPVFRESGCKSTAFPRHNQIFMQKFYIFFITHWLPKYVVKHKKNAFIIPILLYFSRRAKKIFYKDNKKTIWRDFCSYQ